MEKEMPLELRGVASGAHHTTFTSERTQTESKNLWLLLRLKLQKMSNCVICYEISIFMCHEMSDEIHFNAKL